MDFTSVVASNTASGGKALRNRAHPLAVGRDLSTMEPAASSASPAPLAQLAEHLTLNQRVDGSSPSGSTLLLPVRNLASPARGRLVWRCRRLTGASFAALVRESDLPQPDSTLVLCF